MLKMENVSNGNWPEKLYQFTKVQGAVTTYTFMQIMEDRAKYYSNYNQVYWLSQLDIDHGYYTSLESCYEAWIESIEKFKEKVIKQFENKCGIQYKSKTEQRLDDFIKNNWPDEVE